EFRQAIQRWETAPASSCIDIGFKCRFQRHENRPFPLTTAAQHLDIELINPDDLVGYSWAREGFRKVQPILDVWRGPTPVEGVSVSDGNITWTARAPEEIRRIHVSKVDISVDLAFRVSPEKVLYPGGEMAEVFKRIDAHLQQDLGEWRRKLKGYRTGGPDWKKTYAQMNEDRDFQTFRPILVMGETGTGKQWVAEYLARGWKGRRIDAREFDLALAAGLESAESPAANSVATNQGSASARKAAERSRAGDRRLSPFDAADRLPTALERFNLDHSPAGGAARPPRDNFYTFSAVSCPETLLDAALFGIAHHTANDVGAQPGAFLCAGTGVLFLDEMLELPPDQQARLLVALQSGRVRPVGDWREYVYGCRVVVATNRASSEADLRRLEREDKVRSDILARFIQRHTLPPLRRRTLEIIPALGLLLRQERLQRGVDSATPLYIRLSRLA
ncbi:MAG TPA: sigma 54-interacting transcriptional regulator, partial [Pirellulaceae bacterium]|nr:sigma 54-interacting transcriptional regulator [Pirellulaceae bacterium]